MFETYHPKGDDKMCVDEWVKLSIEGIFQQTVAYFLYLDRIYKKHALIFDLFMLIFFQIVTPKYIFINCCVTVFANKSDLKDVANICQRCLYCVFLLFKKKVFIIFF